MFDVWRKEILYGIMNISLLEDHVQGASTLLIVVGIIFYFTESFSKAIEHI